MSTFQDVAKTTEISQGEMKLISLDGEEIVVANVDGTYFAFGNECTHSGGPLVEVELEGKSMTCALGGPGMDPVPTYEIQVEGDSIKVAKR